MAPRSPQVLLVDSDGNFVDQAGTPIRGHANPARFIEPNADGSINVVGGGGGGGGGPVTIADGADVAQGTTTDAATANTVVGLLKKLYNGVAGVLNIRALSSGTDSVAIGGTVSVDPTDRAARLVGHVSVDSLPALPAGSNVIGHVVVDSAGAVSVTSLPSLPAGTAVIGHVVVDSVSGTVTVAGAVSVSNLPADQLVHAANLDLATTALRDALRGASSKTLTDVVNALTSVPVTGTFWQATQPVSLAAAVDVGDRSARLLGHVTVDAQPAVSGSVTASPPVGSIFEEILWELRKQTAGIQLLLSDHNIQVDLEGVA